MVLMYLRILLSVPDTVEQVVGRQSRNHLFLQRNCCDNACSLNFIKTHCPVKRKR